MHHPTTYRSWFWPVLVAAMIFLASSRSHLAAPGIRGDDKVAHFALYGLLATLVVRLDRGREAAWIAVLAVSAYGALDEWQQSFVPGRSVEMARWLGDTGGAALAVARYVSWPACRTRLETPLASQRQIENAVIPARISSS